MTEEKTQENKEVKDVKKEPTRAPVRRSAGGFRKGGANGGGRGRNQGRGGNRRFERQKPEFEQSIISIRRVTRVVAGGRRFGFSVAMVAGDKKGRVGVGTGKATDTSLAIEKALKSAKKNMVTIRRTKEMSIPHAEEVKYSTARIMIMPAPGRGIVAGSAIRVVLDLAGIKDVGAKVISRSKNKLNIARAAVKALEKVGESVK